MVGDSGCEDSEDEWDFIKIDKEAENKQSNNLLENQKTKNKMSSEILNNQLSDNIKDTEIKSDMQSEPLTDEYNEKDLVYNIANTDEKNDENCNENSAESKLNPGAAEFIPRSPASPVNLQNPSLLLLDDPVVAQSPKPNNDGGSVLMENINVPSEIEFDEEISNRPHETEDFIAAAAAAAADGNLNPKEAAQSDEKLEEDYIAISNGVHSSEQNVANLITFDRFNEPEAMNESFYEENRCEELNKIQTLPLSSQDQDPPVEQQLDVNCLTDPIMVDLATVNSWIDTNLHVDDPQSSEDMLEKAESVPEQEMLCLEPEMMQPEVCQVLDPVPDLLNSDPDMNKLVEQCDEKLSNMEVASSEEVTTQVVVTTTTEIEAIMNEANQVVVDEGQKESAPENLLIETVHEVTEMVKHDGEKGEQELIESEKVSEVLIEAIPDVIPKAVEKSSAAPADKPKVPAAKTVGAKKPLGTKTTAAVTGNGVKAATKTTASKTGEVKKPIGSSSVRSANATTAKAAPGAARTATSRVTGVSSAARSVSSTVTRTTTTTTSAASRVGTR